MTVVCVWDIEQRQVGGLSSLMLEIGTTAPDFPVDGTTLYSWLEKGPVVVYFYPADFTPICTKEACMFRDAHELLGEAGIRVIGISPQSQTSHDRFKQAQSLPFTLLSDPNYQVIDAYKSRGMFGLPLPIGVRRVTYLISPQRVIVDRSVGELGMTQHQRLIDRALEMMKPR